MKKTQFNGFSPKSLKFLTQVQQENSRDWFNENREEYNNAVLLPFRALVEALAPTISEIDNYCEVSPAIGKTLSRMNRDTRFSNDKSLYRNRKWLVFKRPKKGWTDAPAFFFEITPNSFSYGLGYYSASRDTMDRFRYRMTRYKSVFFEAISSIESPLTLVGESYKRSLTKESDPTVTTWYNRKSFAVMATGEDMNTLFSTDLTRLLTKAFQQLAPLYQFLMQVEASKEVPLSDL